MKNVLARLYQHYYDYHAYGPPRLKYMGYVGVISLSLLYFVRFTRPNPQLFDDIVPRGLAILMLALLALKDQWPERFKRYYIGYSYAVLVYCLPCFTVLVGLQRGGGMPSVSNSFILPIRSLSECLDCRSGISISPLPGQRSGGRRCSAILSDQTQPFELSSQLSR